MIPRCPNYAVQNFESVVQRNGVGPKYVKRGEATASGRQAERQFGL